MKLETIHLLGITLWLFNVAIANHHFIRHVNHNLSMVQRQLDPAEWSIDLCNSFFFMASAVCFVNKNWVSIFRIVFSTFSGFRSSSTSEFRSSHSIRKTRRDVSGCPHHLLGGHQHRGAGHLAMA